MPGPETSRFEAEIDGYVSMFYIKLLVLALSEHRDHVGITEAKYLTDDRLHIEGIGLVKAVENLAYVVYLAC